MTSLDKDWLDRVFLAYATYPEHSEEVFDFIKWLYKQYGIVIPTERKM
jgi:hypothetical protein